MHQQVERKSINVTLHPILENTKWFCCSHHLTLVRWGEPGEGSIPRQHCTSVMISVSATQVGLPVIHSQAQKMEDVNPDSWASAIYYLTYLYISIHIQHVALDMNPEKSHESRTGWPCSPSRQHHRHEFLGRHPWTAAFGNRWNADDPVSRNLNSKWASIHCLFHCLFLVSLVCASKCSCRTVHCWRSDIQFPSIPWHEFLRNK